MFSLWYFHQFGEEWKHFSAALCVSFDEEPRYSSDITDSRALSVLASATAATVAFGE